MMVNLGWSNTSGGYFCVYWDGLGGCGTDNNGNDVISLMYWF